MSCLNFQMIQAMIKCFERSTVERIEENSNMSRWKRKGEKEKQKQFLQHGLFGFGHPPKHCPRRTGLNFAERTKHVAVLVLW